MNIPYFDKFNSMGFDTTITSQYLNTDNSQIIIVFHGDIETFYTKFFMDAVLNLLNNEKTIKVIFLDFDEVTYVSSSFVASLLQIINMANHNDVNIFFTNLNYHTEQMVDSLGLAHFVKDIAKKQAKPFTIICKKCKRNITVKNFGPFECPHCRTLLNVSKKGVV